MRAFSSAASSFSSAGKVTSECAVLPGSPVRCRILPEDVGLALERPLRTSILNCLPAQVLSLEETDIAAHRLVRLRAGETILLARITRKSARALNLLAGQTVYAMIKAVSFMTDTRSS